MARTPVFCARALACRARTAAHYPLPFTVGDVGFADCATTRSLTGPHSWPAEAEPVRKPATSAHRLCRHPRRFPARTRGPGLPGRTESEDPAGRHGERPFPAVADGYPAPGRRSPLRSKPKGVVFPAEAEKMNLGVRTGAQGRAAGSCDRPARREALPRHITQSPLSKSIHQGNKKSPGGCRTDQSFSG